MSKLVETRFILAVQKQTVVGGIMVRDYTVKREISIKGYNDLEDKEKLAKLEELCGLATSSVEDELKVKEHIDEN